MKNDGLEKFLKDALRDHESSVDPNLVWKGIQEKRKKKDRPLMWLWFLGAFFIFLVGIGIAFYIYQTPSPPLAVNTIPIDKEA